MARRADSMLVAFESLTKLHAADLADWFERMLEPGESLDGLGHRRGVDADNRGNRGRRQHVGEQVTAEQLHRRQRYQRLVAAGCPPHDRVVREHDALRRHLAHREQQTVRTRGRGELECAGIVGVEDGPVRRLLPGKDARLCSGVFLDGRVPVEVIGREVQQHRDPWPERLRALQLKAARLDHVDGFVGRRFDLGAQRQPDVAADEDAVTTGFQHPAGQRRRRRLPFGAGDGDDPAAQPARGQLELAGDRHTRAPRRLDGGQLRRHAGTEHDQIGC